MGWATCFSTSFTTASIMPVTMPSSIATSSTLGVISAPSSSRLRFVDFANPRLMTPEERAHFLEIIFKASGW